jgi:hypothetical protein
MSTTAPAKNEKNTPPESFEGLLALFAKPTPPRFIKKREGWKDRTGNVHMVDYVEWHFVADLLDWASPNWQYRIEDCQWLDGVAVIRASIGLMHDDGTYVWRSGVGTGTPNGQNAQAHETAFKKAEHDALKRAAVKFGIARDLYQSDEPGEVQPASNNQQAARPASSGSQRPSGNQGQSSGGEQITPKQLGYAKSLARDLNKDVDVLVSEWSDETHDSIEDLSKAQGVQFINWLKEYEVF